MVDYLFPTFGQLIDIIPNLKKESESFEVELYSSGRIIVVNYLKNKILISLDHRSKEGMSVKDFPLELLEFASVVIDATNKYIEMLININRSLKHNEFIKALIESKNKAENYIKNI